VVLTISAMIFAAAMLFLCAALPLVLDVPSFRIITGCPDRAISDHLASTAIATS
jgi:hypothetical protein